MQEKLDEKKILGKSYLVLSHSNAIKCQQKFNIQKFSLL